MMFGKVVQPDQRIEGVRMGPLASRDQRREAKRPKSDPAVKLEPSTPPETEGHTVLMPRPKQFDPLPFAETPSPVEQAPATTP